ncbi:hypothetical protein SS50377_27323 [Spironucleus salmonicida]|uniref:Trichohyalin n=1 Tax=Spironucleus salmonicida TaxID=348837 RepID=V6LI38_9EUKA|nr:hypothetical protein SS50377_27323 [Spironucleus salmonicida]|eukprot:EST43376.1 hypothetical protein SS50377_17056 [Spironucleus salmonicida]
MQFDILQSLNVTIPNAQPVAAPSAYKVFSPVIQPPNADFKPQHQPRKTPENLTQKQMEQLTIEQKQLLINQLKYRAETKLPLTAQTPKIVQHEENGWCDCCYNDYLDAKNRAVKQHAVEKERLAAKQIQDRVLVDRLRDQELQKLEKSKRWDEMQKVIGQKEENKHQLKETQRLERQQLRSAQEEGLKKLEDTFKQKKQQQEHQRHAMEDDIQKHQTLKMERKAADNAIKEEYVLPSGLQIDQDVINKRKQEILEQIELQKAQKRAQKMMLNTSNQEQRHSLQQQLDQMALKHEAARKEKLHQQMEEAKRYDEDILRKANAVKQRRDNEARLVKESEKAARDAEKANSAAQLLRAEQQRAQLTAQLQEGQRQKQLNAELERLLERVHRIEGAVKPPRVTQECDRCDEIGSVERIVHLGAEEVADAEKYIALKIGRRGTQE